MTEPVMPGIRILLAGSLAALSCLQAACTTVVRPDHLVERDQRSHGRIAVVAARFEPAYEFSALTTGQSDAAARGALHGVGSCAQAIGHGSGAVGGLLWLVCAPIAATVGAVSGASGAATAEQVEAAKASAQRAINALKLQETVLQAMLRYAEAEGLRVGRFEGKGPANQADLPSYTEAKDAADTIIEVSVLNARAVTTGQRDLQIGLGMQARVRVLSTREGKEVDTFTVRGGAGELRNVDQWLAADGELIRTGFERSAARIAEQALDEILLIYHPKALPPQPATGETERVPPYALRAIEPPIRNKVYWDMRRTTYGHLERYPLESLQPEFRWEAWPRGFDIHPGSGPGQAREVRYDLRILGAGGVAYERRGLAQTAHRLEQPLKPCSTYRWTMRARFMYNDAPRVTEWTGAYDTKGGAVAPWWIRRGSGAPALALIPGNAALFYPIIETPSAGGEACPGR